MIVKSESWVLSLSEHLFWDVDQTKVDSSEHLKWLIERVVERGSWNDWVILTSHVTAEQISSLLLRLRLPPREMSFLKTFLDVVGAC